MSDTVSKPPRDFTVRLGTFGVALRTRDPEIAAAVNERYGAFFTESRVADLVLDLERVAAPTAEHSLAAYEARLRLQGAALEIQSSVVDGSVDLDSCRGRLTIAPHPRFGAGVYLENALRQICQVLAIPRGAFLFHAAAIMPPGDSRGVQIFSGPSGAGKTTISGILQAAGGKIITDDLVLVDASGPRPVVAPTPFYGELREKQVMPAQSLSIRSLNFLAKDEVARLDVIDERPFAIARVMSNIPFTGGIDREHQMRLMASVARLVSTVPARFLHFALDTSFLPLLGWQAPAPPAGGLRGP